jgi:hypothetical protein
MNVNLALEDFLNYFSCGFFFVFGMSITNLECTKILLHYLKDTIGDNYILVGFVFIYIIGFIIFSFTSALSDLSTETEKILNESPKTCSIKLLGIINLILLDIPFRRWSVIGTFNRLSTKEKLPPEISHIKTYNELLILAEKISKESKDISRLQFYRSQFLQTCADSVFFVLVINIALCFLPMNNSQTLSIGCIVIICIPVFFVLKALSPVFAKWYFIIIARKAKAFGLDTQ